MAVEEMTTQNTKQMVDPIRRSISVKATPERAFRVFTEEMDSWWPRTHHIGKSPMKEVVVERREGGTIFTRQEDGTDCAWGSVKVWDPPRRFVMWWQIDPEWKYEPDLAKCSEVEITFTAKDDGTTLVELEHRNFERHGGDFVNMRKQVNSEGGWGSLLELYAERAAKENA